MSGGGWARMRSRMMLVALAAVAAGCSSDCVTPPCPFPLAAHVSVTSAATGAPITNASVIVNGDTAHATPCNGTCYVPGALPGKYELDISAPGFHSAARSINLTVNAAPKCGCSILNQQ